MAFDSANFRPVDPTMRTSDELVIHTHKSSDDLGTIQASGYYDDVANWIKTGDLVAVQGSNGRRILRLTNTSDVITTTVEYTGETARFCYNPLDYGALADNSTDDTDAWNDAITALEDSGMSGKLLVPVGNSIISDPIEIDHNVPYSMEGTASALSGTQGHGSIIKFTGTETTTILKLINPLFSIFERFGIVSGGSNPIDGITIETKSGATTRNCEFKYIRMQGGSGLIKKGFLTTDPSTQGNNDHHRFDHCEVVNYRTAGISFEHDQSKWHTVSNCNFNANQAYFDTLYPGGSGDEDADGPYGVCFHLGTTGAQAGNGGSGVIRDNMFFRNAIDIVSSNPNDCLNILSNYGENTRRFVKIGPEGFSGVGYPVNVKDNRWIGGDGYMETDELAMKFGTKGPFNIEGNEIKNNTSSKIAKIHVYTTGAMLRFGGNLFASPGAADTFPVTGELTAVCDLGNMYRNAADDETIFAKEDVPMFGSGRD